jgi:hypothetical protein
MAHDVYDIFHGEKVKPRKKGSSPLQVSMQLQLAAIQMLIQLLQNVKNVYKRGINFIE